MSRQVHSYTITMFREHDTSVVETIGKSIVEKLENLDPTGFPCKFSYSIDNDTKISIIVKRHDGRSILGTFSVYPNENIPDIKINRFDQIPYEIRNTIKDQIYQVCETLQDEYSRWCNETYILDEKIKRALHDSLKDISYNIISYYVK